MLFELFIKNNNGVFKYRNPKDILEFFIHI